MNQIQGSTEFDDKRHERAIITITVRGMRGSDLLMHRMSEETIMMLFKGGNKSRKDVTPLEKARDCIYRKPDDGSIVIPSFCLRAAMVEAGRSVPLEKRVMLSTKETSRVDSVLSFVDDFYPLTIRGVPLVVEEEEADQPWSVDMRRGLLRNGAAKTVVPIVRPRFKLWGFVATIHYRTTNPKIGEDKIRKLVAIAGDEIGIGSFRPACRGPFGRFEIKEWNAVYYTAEEYETMMVAREEAELLAAK